MSEIRSLIIELGKSHSVILSSHILPEIQAVCGRVTIINRGRVVYNESLDALRGAQASVVAAFRRAPEQAALAGIAGVASATHLGDGRWQLEAQPGADVREALAEAAVRSNWGLIELRAQAQTLEEIFVSLTSGDDAARKAA